MEFILCNNVVLLSKREKKPSKYSISISNKGISFAVPIVTFLNKNMHTI